MALIALLLTGPSLEFRWSESSGSPSHYQVEMQMEGSPTLVFTTTLARASVPASLGRDVQIRVRGCGSTGCSAWSPPSARVSLNRSADFDGDGIVQLNDYLILLEQQGGAGAADLDGDGIVGALDGQELLEHFGSCTGEVIVEGRRAPAYVACLGGASGPEPGTP